MGSDVVRTANLRIITATNQKLAELLRQGRFRKDLNYRLQTHRIYIPPLRQRLDDIPLLLEHFVKSAAERLGKPQPAVPEALAPLLATHSFPGNVRELESMVFDAVSRHRSGPLALDSFRSKIRRAPELLPAVGAEEDGEAAILFPPKLPSIKEAVRLLILEALRRCEGNQSRAAKLLGVSQQALSKRLKPDKTRRQ